MESQNRNRLAILTKHSKCDKMHSWLVRRINLLLQYNRGAEYG